MISENMTKVYRSRTDRVIFGVCGGLARYFGVDSTILRLIFILATIYHGSGILIYIILAVIMPEEKKDIVEGVEEIPESHERRKLLAAGLILLGVYFLLKDFIFIPISSSQVFGLIIILLGIALLLKRR
jgi:phage shock protein C